MTVYRTSNQPRRRLAYAGRWLLAFLLLAVAVLLADAALAVSTGGARAGVEVPWLVLAAVIAVWFSALAVPPPLARPAVPVPLPPPAPDCVAPTAAYVVGTETVMTPADLDRLWRAPHHQPPHDPVIRRAFPDAGDGQDGHRRG